MKNLTSVQLGYTDNGNRYKKTDVGKKAGTIAGAVAGGAIIDVTDKGLCKLARMTKSVASVKKPEEFFINSAADFAKDTVSISGIKAPKHPLVKTVAQKFVTSLKGRFVLIAGAVAGAIFAGKVLGSVIDAGLNKLNQFKADKQAEQKEAVIQEYETQKADEE